MIQMAHSQSQAQSMDAAAYRLYTGTMTAAEVTRKFGGLIAARFRRHLADGRVPADRRLFTAGAMLDGTPVGLALAAPPTDQEPATVRSLGVVPEHRRSGVGTALLAALEDNLRGHGVSTVQASYRSDLEHVAALERIAEKRGWDAPRAVRRLYRARRENVLGTPLLEADPLPDGFELFAWSDLTRDEQAALRQRQDAATDASHPIALDPFQLPDRLSTSCSVGVRRNGHVMGWMVLHRLSDDVMQYTSLFVSPTLHRHQVARVLLAEAIRCQINHTDATRGVWMVDLANAPILRFIDRYLQAHVDTSADLLVVGKRLS